MAVPPIFEENISVKRYGSGSISNFLAIAKVIGNIKILSRDLKQNSKREKSKQVDLLLKLDDRKINIEISNTTSSGRKERDLVYLSNIHGQQLRYKENYSKIGSSWQIRLNDVPCNNGVLRRTYYMMSDDKDRIKYSEKFRIDNIDLEVASKMSYNESDEKLVRWCRILNASTRDEIVRELGDNLMDKEAREKLLEEVERNSRDEELYDLHEMYSRDEMERRTELVEAIEENTEKEFDFDGNCRSFFDDSAAFCERECR